MSEELTLEELSRSTGEPVERLGQWRSLGLIGAEGGERFRPEDVEKVRLVQLFLRRGISVEAIARAAKGGLLDRYVERLLPGSAGPTYSLAEAAEMLGMDLGLLRRLWEASGLSEQGETANEEDMEANPVQKIRAIPMQPYPVHPYAQIFLVASDATFAWTGRKPREAIIHLVRLIPPLVELHLRDP